MIDPVKTTATAESMIISNDNLGLCHLGQHILRHQTAGCVVALRITRVQHAEPVTDRDAGRNDQEAL